MLARADLEALLRDRRLDRTLTTARPLSDGESPLVAATGITALDERLGGGLPRGELSEIVGPPSSGRTSVLLATLAAATRRGEIAAYVDPGDALDVTSAAAAGVVLDRLLWIRPGGLDRAVKAFGFVLEAGGFGVAALDLVDVPAGDVRALPWATWLRLERFLIGTPTVAVLVAGRPTARSARGVTIGLAPAGPCVHGEVAGVWRQGLFRRLDVTARVIQARRIRWRDDEAVAIALEAQAWEA